MAWQVLFICWVWTTSLETISFFAHYSPVAWATFRFLKYIHLFFSMKNWKKQYSFQKCFFFFLHTWLILLGCDLKRNFWQPPKCVLILLYSSIIWKIALMRHFFLHIFPLAYFISGLRYYLLSIALSSRLKHPFLEEVNEIYKSL